MSKEKEEDKKDEHHPHDLGYKQLLSFIEMFRQLIQGYIKESWKDQLDYSKAQRIDKEYVLPDFKKRESDIIYKVPLIQDKDEKKKENKKKKENDKTEKEVFLYVLVEHQSTIDHSIPFRLLFYLTQVWYDIYKNMTPGEQKAKSFSLPPVFPIVLYNGNPKWTVKPSLKQIVQKGELFGDFLPSLKYHLIDISRQGREKLEKEANTLAAVFLLEQENPKTDDLSELVQNAIEWVKDEPNYELWKTFMMWLARFLQDSYDSTEDILENFDFENKNKEEITTMIETLPKKLIQLEGKKSFIEGREKGLEEGREKGLKEGILGLLEAARIMQPEIYQRYKDVVHSAQTMSELQSIKNNILQEMDSRKKD